LIEKYLKECKKNKECEELISENSYEQHCLKENHDTFNFFIVSIVFVFAYSVVYLLSPVLNEIFLSSLQSSIVTIDFEVFPKFEFTDQQFSQGIFSTSAIIYKSYFLIFVASSYLSLVLSIVNLNKKITLFFFILTVSILFLANSLIIKLFTVVFFLFTIAAFFILCFFVFFGGINLLYHTYRHLTYNDLKPMSFIIDFFKGNVFSYKKNSKNLNNNLNALQEKNNTNKEKIKNIKSKIFLDQKELTKAVELRYEMEDEESKEHLDNLIKDFENKFKKEYKKEYYKELIDVNFKSVVIEND
jgi:hypothetical protein